MNIEYTRVRMCIYTNMLLYLNLITSHVEHKIDYIISIIKHYYYFIDKLYEKLSIEYICFVRWLTRGNSNSNSYTACTGS